MAYAMTKQGSLTNFITYEFICDTVADMNAIETEYRTLGSVAIVLAGESGMEVYMAGSDKEWNSLTSLGGNAAPPGLTIYICGQNEVSNGLPDVEEPDDTTLYLIPAQNETNNLYEEYVWVNDAWEKFGGATLDLSGYATLQDIAGFYTKPNGGIPASDLAESYVKTTDIATQSTAGLVKVLDNGNVTFNENNQLVLTLAGTAVVKTGQSDHPISVTHQHEAAFYGLAKAAGQDMKNSGNAVGTYTTEAASAIRTMIGAGTYTKPAGGIPANDLAETYLTQHQDISGKANSADLAAVATSGSYNDLSNKPTIPDVSGFYTKPVGGIPAADLEDTYLTSFTETDPTVPAWAKSENKPTYTAQEVGALPANTVIPTVPSNVSAFTNDAGYLTTHQDISGKVDKVSGKGLSTNDFTNIYKEQLDNLSSSNINEMTTNESDVIFDEVFGDYIYTQSSTTMTSSELNDMLTDIFGGD